MIYIYIFRDYMGFQCQCFTTKRASWSSDVRILLPSLHSFPVWSPLPGISNSWNSTSTSWANAFANKNHAFIWNQAISSRCFEKSNRTSSQWECLPEFEKTSRCWCSWPGGIPNSLGLPFGQFTCRCSNWEIDHFWISVQVSGFSLDHCSLS